jgi:CheY-like chemotaxis protein
MFRDLSILIVDDNATNRMILRETLRHWNMNADEVEGGAQALDALQAAKSAGHPYDLVLLDAQMPNIDGFDVAGRIQQDPELARGVVVMLSSVGLKGDGARCRELGIKAYLPKPIKQSHLLEAIKAVLGRQKEYEQARSLVTIHSLAEDRRRLKILLAEDNAVNQKVASRFLEKRGHTVVVTESGKKALAAWQEQPFDLILMDVQMPEMDGFEATAIIREQEKSGAKHTPIIAMTAHAMVGDRERCLAAGMDDYVSKPINADDLFAAIARLMPVASQAHA